MCHAAIAICHQCELRGKAENFVARCTVNGRDIVENASARKCPNRRFPADLVCDEPEPVRLSLSHRVRLLCFREIARLLAWGVKNGSLRRLSRRSDRGAGDTLARIIHWILRPLVLVRFVAPQVTKDGSDRYLLGQVYRMAKGSCQSCGNIQQKLNEDFPYSS